MRNREQTHPLVYVIVLHWKNYEHTQAAIKSILAGAYQNYRLLIIDNGSHDGSVEALQQKFPEVRFILNERNLGFARGCNVGIREALGDPNCAYVLLMNNDATILAESLGAAVAAAEADHDIGIISGKILLASLPHTIWYAGGRLDFWRGQAVTRGFGEMDRGQYDLPCETGFVTGALMLIKKTVLTSIGPLPEEYFFGVEEWDYSARARQAGFKLYYVPGFFAYHAADGSHWNYDPKFVYNSYRNKLIFQQKYLPRLVFPVWKAAFAVYGKYVARRARQRLIDKKLFPLPRPVDFERLDFALARAIEDHGKNTLTEEVLDSFESEMQARFRPDLLRPKTSDATS
ncbi:MAG TPA: glycosyltransferase family 2 protein [Pyrinomonadaceae bacterium]|nr:glycosyltransferase family 2 protein [Pyrinomonadaceae bacterium]